MSEFKPSPSLLSFRDHCRRMALDTHNQDEAKLWVRLANEIDAYTEPKPVPDEGLF